MANIDETNCCVCGVKIYFDHDYYVTLKNKHQSFYCLNGHSQSFVSKSEAEIQKEINKSLTEVMNKNNRENQEVINKLQEKVKELSKFEHKCKICQKDFTSLYNLNRHIKNVHTLKVKTK